MNIEVDLKDPFLYEMLAPMELYKITLLKITLLW